MVKIFTIILAMFSISFSIMAQNKSEKIIRDGIAGYLKSDFVYEVPQGAIKDIEDAYIKIYNGTKKKFPPEWFYKKACLDISSFKFDRLSENYCILNEEFIQHAIRVLNEYPGDEAALKLYKEFEWRLKYALEKYYELIKEQDVLFIKRYSSPPSEQITGKQRLQYQTPLLKEISFSVGTSISSNPYTIANFPFSLNSNIKIKELENYLGYDYLLYKITTVFNMIKIRNLSSGKKNYTNPFNGVSIFYSKLIPREEYIKRIDKHINILKNNRIHFTNIRFFIKLVHTDAVYGMIPIKKGSMFSVSEKEIKEKMIIPEDADINDYVHFYKKDVETILKELTPKYFEIK